MHAFPGVHPVSLKDLDLYIVRVPQPTDTALQIVLADTAAGSDVNRTPALATGDYYLVVVDFAGTTTNYEVCVGVAPLLVPGDCSNAVFPVPPAAAAVSVAPLRAKHRLSARRPSSTPITPTRR